MSTKIVRLTSGEEIICSYSEEGDICELRKPAIIIPTGQGQLGLMPWLAYADLADKSIKIDKKFIVFTADAQNDLLNEYSTAFGSGLFVPAKPGPALAGGGPMGVGATDIGGKKPKLTLKK